jgi:hypothetical protein
MSGWKECSGSYLVFSVGTLEEELDGQVAV